MNIDVGEHLKIAPSAPERLDPRHAVAFAVQVPSKATDPKNGLTQSRRGRLGRGRPLVDVRPKRAPFVRAQRVGAGRLRLETRQIAKLQNAGGNGRVKSDNFFDALGGVKAYRLGPTAALEDVVKFLDDPPLLVYGHNAQGLFEIPHGLGGPQQPMQGLGALGRIGLENLHERQFDRRAA